MGTLRNKVSLIGVVATTLDTVNGVAQFSVQTVESKREDDGTWKTILVDHVIQASGSIVRRLHGLQKGVEVIVEGRLMKDKYKTRRGNVKFGTVIELTEFLVLSAKQ
jgi:single-stranded DNA-binding protein